MTSQIGLLPSSFVSLLIFVFGLIWGSFFNVCIVRLPKDESIFKGRSHCPRCRVTIPWFCNIPVLSYLFLKGRCKSCKEPISIEYPLIELLTAFLYVGLFWQFGPSKEWISSLIFCSSLLVVSVIDLHHQIIPDEISLPGIPLGFVMALWVGNITWLESLLGSVVGGGSFLFVAWLYEKLAKREGLGGGDIKLLAMIGAWLGIHSLLSVIVISSLTGSVVGIGAMLIHKKDFKTAIPFGPFLALGALVYLLFGEPIQALLVPSL